MKTENYYEDDLYVELSLVYNRIRYWRSRMKIREIIKLIEKDGWYLVNQEGSHRQYKHPQKLGRVTIAGHPSDDIAPGTLNSIMKQAGFKGGKKK